LSLLRQCCSVADIHDLEGNRVVSFRNDVKRLCFYVPRGTHTLEITTTWKPAATPDPAAGSVTDRSATVGEKTCTVTLLPLSGYCRLLANGKEHNTLEGELASNYLDFKNQKAAIPLAHFLHQSSS